MENQHSQDNKAIQRKCEPKMDKHLADSQGLKTGAAQLKPNASSTPQANSATTSKDGSLPTQLKENIESMSGFDMSDVKVHYNSDKPAQLQAHAYAQGTDIHLAGGQEKHLAHEAWHVVQQKQGRVQPTTQLKGAGANDNASLEYEADVMGAKALSSNQHIPHTVQQKSIGEGVIQGKWAFEEAESLFVLCKKKGITAVLQEFDLPIPEDPSSLIQAENIFWLTCENEAYYSIQGLRTLLASVTCKQQDEEDDSDHIDGGEAREEELMPGEATEQYANWAGELTKKNAMAWDTYCQICDEKGYFPNNVSFFYWFYSPVFTRSQLAAFLEKYNQAKRQYKRDPIQCKRGPGDSTQALYTGKNGAIYQNVTYTRDNDGIFDFAKPKPSPTSWTNPIMGGSEVNLEEDCTTKGYGLTLNNTKVKIAQASRTQHFSIGDRVYAKTHGGTPNRAGTWTWHHLKAKYKMQLVDMTVHAKHGHNGGFLLWNS